MWIKTKVLDLQVKAVVVKTVADTKTLGGKFLNYSNIDIDSIQWGTAWIIATYFI